MKKITLEEFRHIKPFLLRSLETNEKAQDYVRYLNVLFSYDLSGIPFEEWEGVLLQLFNSDLSRSCPNLDFSLLDQESTFFYVDFKGCQLKNLDSGVEIDCCDISHYDEVQKEQLEFLHNIFSNDVLYYNAINGELEVGTCRKYKDLMTEKQLRFWTRNGNRLNIEKLFGTIENYFSLVDPSLDDFYIFNDGIMLSNKAIQNEEGLKEYINTYIKEEFPVNMTLEAIKTLMKYLSLKDLQRWCLIEENDRLFIEKCGIDHMLATSSAHHHFLDQQYYSMRGMNTTFLYTLFSRREEEVFSEDFKIEEYICNQEIIEQYYDFKNKKQLTSSEEVYQYLQLIVSLARCRDFITNKDFFPNVRDVFPRLFTTREEIEKAAGQDSIEEGDISFFRKAFYKSKGIHDMFLVANTHPSILPLLKEKQILIPREYKVYYNHLSKDDFYQNMTSYGPFMKVSLELGEDTIENFFTKYKEDIKSTMDEIIVETIKKRRALNGYSKFLLPQEFQNAHPELFTKLNNFVDQEQFYKQNIDAAFFSNQLQDLQLYQEIFKNTAIHIMFKNSEIDCTIEGEDKNIYEILGLHFTNSEIIHLMGMYGELFDTIAEQQIFSTNFKKEEILSVFYQKAIDLFLDRNLDLWILPKDEEFKKRNPNLYLSEDAPSELKTKFANRSLSFGDFHLHNTSNFPLYLKDKTTACFKFEVDEILVNQLIDLGIEKEKLYRLFEIYGHLLNQDIVYIKVEEMIKMQNIKENKESHNLLHSLEEAICYGMYELFKQERITLNPTGEEFQLFKKMYPSLFLDDKASKDFSGLCYASNLSLDFINIFEFKKDISYLKGKDFKLFFRKRIERDFISSYDEDIVLSMFTKNILSLSKMIESGQASKAVWWHKKYHFLPHASVMLNTNETDADKFIANGRKWSKLMQYSYRCKDNEEYVEALFKASMVFGVFDNDEKAYNTILNLFLFPNKLSKEDKKIYYRGVDEREKEVNQALNRLYRNGRLDYQAYIDMSLEDYHVLQIRFSTLMDSLLPEELHQIFGGMDTKYKPAFREFFLENLKYTKKNGYLSKWSAIERNFEKIVSFNKGRKLTFDKALDYISTISYENIEPGNDYLASLASKSGYDEEDFEDLQLIYHFAKIRTTNSIPRILGKADDFTYEILRLDDPLALVIGELTDCCQALHDAAESSMIHSATDDNGRVFVVRNADNSIAAQSWVWRKNGTICFDNIEIPERLLKKEDRKAFIKKILFIYQQASTDLLEKENKVYQKLLDEGKISKEEFYAMKLSKVTVGMGYNDIKDAIVLELEKDFENVKPHEFCSVIDFSSNLYLDSREQYILKEDLTNEKKAQTESSPLYTYHDTFAIYSEENIDIYKKQVLSEMLEEEIDRNENLFEELEDVYEIKKENIRIVMNYNFAFILEEQQGNIFIKDVCFMEDKELDREEEVYEQMSYAYSDLKEKYKNVIIAMDEEKKKMIEEKIIQHKEDLKKDNHRRK